MNWFAIYFVSLSGESEPSKIKACKSIAKNQTQNIARVAEFTYV